LRPYYYCGCSKIKEISIQNKKSNLGRPTHAERGTYVLIGRIGGTQYPTHYEEELRTDKSSVPSGIHLDTGGSLSPGIGKEELQSLTIRHHCLKKTTILENQAVPVAGKTAESDRDENENDRKRGRQSGLRKQKPNGRKITFVYDTSFCINHGSCTTSSMECL
jgi:hypothetical protein